jgi:hypothetical protein
MSERGGKRVNECPLVAVPVLVLVRHTQRERDGTGVVMND